MASIFPFIGSETQELAEANKSLPVFQEYAVNFETGELLLRNGQTYLVERNEALKIWIHKALYTVRYRHIAYTRAYGNEAESLIGRTLDSEIVESELRRFIIEALMVNPYITELTDFTFAISGSRVAVHFTCITVYGSLPYTYTQAAA